QARDAPGAGGGEGRRDDPQAGGRARGARRRAEGVLQLQRLRRGTGPAVALGPFDMRVLGLDPGSRRTGFGIVEKSGNQLRCLRHGTVAPAARLAFASRLSDIATKVGEVIETWSPDAVVVEQAFFHLNVRSTLVLGHVRGALLVTAAQRGLTVAEY